MQSDRVIKANSHAATFIKEVVTWVQNNVYSGFTLEYKLDWSLSRTSSRGGMYAKGPGINMAMAHLVPISSTYRYHEYASFDKDPYIGGFYSSRSYDKLEAVILHEIAHALQFFEYKKLNIRCKPHGPIFKKYYRMLRGQFLNHKLPNQSSLLTKVILNKSDFHFSTNP